MVFFFRIIIAEIVSCAAKNGENLSTLMIGPSKLKPTGLLDHQLDYTFLYFCLFQKNLLTKRFKS